MGMKPRVNRKCPVCKKPLTSAKHNRKCCSPECAMKRRMAKQRRRRGRFFGFSSYSIMDEWAK